MALARSNGQLQQHFCAYKHVFRAKWWQTNIRRISIFTQYAHAVSATSARLSTRTGSERHSVCVRVWEREWGKQIDPFELAAIARRYIPQIQANQTNAQEKCDRKNRLLSFVASKAVVVSSTVNHFWCVRNSWIMTFGIMHFNCLLLFLFEWHFTSNLPNWTSISYAFSPCHACGWDVLSSQNDMESPYEMVKYVSRSLLNIIKFHTFVEQRASRAHCVFYTDEWFLSLVEHILLFGFLIGNVIK